MHLYNVVIRLGTGPDSQAGNARTMSEMQSQVMDVVYKR